jgi:hypothetical protein
MKLAVRLLLPVLLIVPACGDDTVDGPDLAVAIDLGAGACDASISAAPDEIALPNLSGPYTPVRGVRRTVLDSTRAPDGSPRTADPDLGTGTGAARAIGVEVWYPANPCSSGKAAPYIDAAEAVYLGLAAADVPKVRTHTITGAPFADGPKRPLLIFSPAYAAQPRVYTAYIEAMVSQGYVVAEISHPLWTPLTVLADGTTITGTHMPGTDPATMQAELAVWTADAKVVLDAIVAANGSDPAGELTGHLDTSHIGMFGHSFGGATSITMLGADARIAAAIDLDGSLFGAVTTTVTRPMLLFRSDRPMDTSWAPVYDGATGPAWMLQLSGSVHFTFSDGAILNSGMFAGSLDGSYAVRLVSDYIHAFFSHALEGQAQPLLDAESPSYPEVVFAKKP